MRKILTILSIIILCLIACNDSTTEPETKEFLNTLWELESFRSEGEIIRPPEGQNQVYTITFRKDSVAYGICNCNEFSASLIFITNDSLRMEGFFMSEKGCDGDKIYCVKYITGLHGARSYKIDKNMLTIFDKNNSKLVFIGQ